MYFRRVAEKKIKRDILSLNQSEKAVLREFYLKGQFSLELPYEDSTVVGLISKRILFSTSPFNDTILISGNNSTFKIGDRTRELIMPWNLDYPQEGAPQEEVDKIMSLRPHWVKTSYY